MPFDRSQSAGYLLSLAARKLTHSLQQRIAALGITPGQFSVLLELADDDGLTQRDLCVRLSVEQGTMAHTIRRMVRDELVHLTKHESDARSSRLYLTAKAREVLPAATEAAAEANAEAFSALTPEEVRRLVDYLRRLVDLEKANDEHVHRAAPRSPRSDRE